MFKDFRQSLNIVRKTSLRKFGLLSLDPEYMNNQPLSINYLRELHNAEEMFKGQ